ALSSGELIDVSNVAYPVLGSGVTAIQHDNTSGGAGVVALPASLSGGATGKDLLLQIEATVDQTLNGGTPIAAQSFVNTVAFRWAAFGGGARDFGVTTNDEPVSFTAVVPAITPASVTKIASEYRRSDAVTPFVPATASVTNRLAASPTFRGVAVNATATNT